MDYYLTDPDGLVVEEFVLADDFTAVAIRTAAWTRPDGWFSDAAVSRALRGGTGVRAVTREDADRWYRHHAGTALPPESLLRNEFRDDLALNPAPPLRLGPPDGPPRYRLLCAGEPTAQPTTGPGWDLRRVGGVAWAVDVTPHGDHPVGPMLDDLRTTARSLGLVPVTVERFS